jgi:HlyD family secretion protein
MSTHRRHSLHTFELAFALPLVMALAACESRRNDSVLEASGTVEATEAELGFPATGRLDSLLAREGDPVARGQRLAMLDHSETQARLQEAKARGDAMRAALTELERGSRPEEVAQSRAALDAAVEKHSDAERDLQRVEKLFEGGAVSQEALDKAVLQERVAKSQRDHAQEQHRLMEKGPRREKIAQQRALLAQAEAQVQALEAQLANLTILSPLDGVVTVRHREPGEIVPAGSPVLTIMDPGDRWVRIYVNEDRIGQVKLAAPATLTTDSFPDKEYRGEVRFIASQAEFTPKNVQTAEERVKLVYEVKVRIAGDEALDLKPGMPADVRLDLPST